MTGPNRSSCCPTAEHSRRQFFGRAVAGGAAAALMAHETRPLRAANPLQPPRRRVPVIDTTDLYHPHQDCGDNRDLIVPYALPEIDLRAVGTRRDRTVSPATGRSARSRIHSRDPIELDFQPQRALRHHALHEDEITDR